MERFAKKIQMATPKIWEKFQYGSSVGKRFPPSNLDTDGRCVARMAEVTGCFEKRIPAPEALFDELVSYYQGVPAETARFTKDSEMLQAVERISGERVALVRELETAIHELAVNSQ